MKLESEGAVRRKEREQKKKKTFSFFPSHYLFKILKRKENKKQKDAASG